MPAAAQSLQPAFRGPGPLQVRVAWRELDLAGDLSDLIDAFPAGDDLLLFERVDGPSVLVDRAAAVVELRGDTATVTGVDAVLDHLRHRFAERVAERRSDRLSLRFPRCDDHDPEVRLDAPLPLDVLRALSLELAVDDGPLPPFLLGVLAFEHVDMLERLPPSAEDPTGYPDARFHLAASAIVRQPDGRAHAVAYDFAGEDPRPALDLLVNNIASMGAAPTPHPAKPVGHTVDLDDAAYVEVVRRAKAHIAVGDVFQIVPSRTFSVPCPDPVTAYRRLRRLNPSPAMFYLRQGDAALFGASPETAVRVDHDEAGALRVEISPIAGTRPTDADPAELLDDEKEVAEHMMLVDLARNDVARVSVPGTRRVESLMRVERFSHVQHLVSRVIGRLRPDRDAVHALVAGMNLGTLSGAPKLKATELLRTLERTRRGPYGGAVGWIAADGRMDTAVVIRSALVINGVAQVRAGAGVVQDSDPQAEADETRRKAAAVLTALGAVA